MEPSLAYLGFSSAGPVGGSIAAAFQSVWGPIASGSWFAASQSAAMTGAGGAAAAGAGAGAAKAAAVGAAVL
ncbi:hypothetical protein IAT40_000363 [Kwoniella sp. CBS 6097]